MTADVRSLHELGADIARHDLASDPTAFTDDETVRAFMHTVGSSGLPLTVVDGVTVATGAYPTRETLLELAGLGPQREASVQRVELGLTEKANDSCCGGTGCC